MKIAAVFARTRPTGPLLSAMLEAQRLRSWHQTQVFPCQGGAAGAVFTSDQSGSVRLVREGSRGNWLAITGVPIDLGGKLDERLSRCVDLSHNEAILDLQQLDGAFAAVHWDASAGKLAVVTDILGMQPLHMHWSSEVFALATDVKALTAAKLVPDEMDAAGWGSFLSMKHPIAGRTLVKNVKRVPPASTLVYDPASGSVTIETYWRWPDLRDGGLEAMPTREIVDAFLDELQAYRAHTSNAVLCLSGGFDSRIILAGLHRIGAVPDTLSMSHADELCDMDSRLAARLARMYGAKFTFHDLDPSFYSSRAYIDYLVANELATPSLYLFIAQLSSKLNGDTKAVWEGVFPGCVLHPVHQPPGGFAGYLKRECASFDGPSWKAAEMVFHRDLVQHMREAFSECLEEEKAQYKDNDSSISQFVVRNRTRHRIAINPLQVYANDALPLTPGLSKRFWSLAASVPYELRAHHRLYQHIFKNFFPEAMKAPAVSGTTLYPLNTVLDRDYLLARAGEIATRRPKIGRIMNWAGLGQVSDFWKSSSLVDAALENIDEGAPEISATGIAKLRNSKALNDKTIDKAKQLVFYWTWWRRIHAAGFAPSSMPSTTVHEAA